MAVHRWCRQIDSGGFRSASELAAHEKITDSYVGKMLTLTLLALDFTRAILIRPTARGAQAGHAAPWDSARPGGAVSVLGG